ncbi:GntR family transcriptional regulator [Sphingobium lactosutens]|uniref:HTH gntR-type domain-containing protein n=1 Tax=Sphingobium lactosutens DS20 TaxID=1331060 RepID=T0IQG5_9SPHN|nr:GntR family transcriptional regulator [Sphingobium lactosutens]EQB14100.1 hypothetical protein RLDS_14335 [Sphingobium lactosutens DS20]
MRSGDQYLALSGDEPSAHPRSPFEKTYRGIVRGIYEGRYAPGQRLIAPDLMAEFQVGRGTIREVLNRLASGGIVSIIKNRGARVRTLSRAETLGILDIVELMLGLAARKAADAITDPDAAAQLQILEQVVQSHKSLTDFDAFLKAREAYYRYIVALSGNAELGRLFPGAQVQIMRLQLRTFNRVADSVQFDDYAKMTSAILSGNGDMAEQAVRRHVRETAAQVAALPDRAFS